jgi:hypothetical protein
MVTMRLERAATTPGCPVGPALTVHDRQRTGFAGHLRSDGTVRRLSFQIVEFFLHLMELARELHGEGESRVYPRDEKRLRVPFSADSSCYPHYVHFDQNQAVYEEDLL